MASPSASKSGPAGPRAPGPAAAPHHEWVVGPPRHTGETVPYSGIAPAVREAYGDPLFRSFWGVPADKSKYIEENGSLSGYDGSLLLPELVLDIDGPTLQSAQDVMLECVRVLREGHGVPDAAIQVWFSGGKGYHLHLPPGLMDTTDPPLLKEWVQNTFGPLCGMKEEGEAHLDVSLLGDPTKLIRVPWSAHETTGRHKVPIQPSDRAESPGTHAEWASDPSEHIDKPHPPFEASVEPLTEAKPDPEASVSNGPNAANVRSQRRTENANTGEGNDEEEDVPLPHYVTCMHHLAERGPIDGRRHDDMLRMAAANAYRGLSKGEIEAALKDWLHAPGKGLPLDDDGKQDASDMAARATGQHPHGDDERWDRFQCDDEIMSEFCDSQCIFYKYREEENPIATSDQRDEALLDYLTMDATDGIQLGQAVGSSTDACVIRPTEIATFYGNTGLGKTSLMQQTALAHPDLTFLDISTEMALGLQERRYLQIKEGLAVEDDNPDASDTTNEVRLLLEEEGTEHVQAMRQDATDHIEIMTTAPSLADLERFVRENQADVVILDPVGKLRVGDEGHKDAVRSIYKGLKDMSTRLDITFLCVRHIRKAGMGDFLPDLSEMKGFKEVAEESDHVFAFGGERDKTVRRLKRMKGTLDIDFDVWLQGDPRTLRFQAVRRTDAGQDQTSSSNGISNQSNLPS